MTNQQGGISSQTTAPLLRSHQQQEDGTTTNVHADDHHPHPRGNNKLTVLPLVFLIYFEVAGGPSRRPARCSRCWASSCSPSCGACLSRWSRPSSPPRFLSTCAFGPLAGSLLGTWKYLSCVVNVAAYPALVADYLDQVGGVARTCTVVGMTVVLSLVSYAGLSVVGWGAVALGFVSLAPFVLMTAMAVPKLQPRRWTTQVQGRNKDWRLFFNILFWNLNYWDSASTMAGEVDRPERTFPRALGLAVVLIIASYLLPLMAATGATDAPPEAWANGYLADAAGVIGGAWLKYWIDAGAVLSSIGMFEAQLSSGAYQLLGMADLGLLPAIFARRAARFRTPWVAIATSAAITLAVSFLPLDDVVATANFLYGLGTLLEFAAFLWLRAARPDLKRPFRVPLAMPALVAMCALPSAFLAYVSVVAGERVFALAGTFTALGFGLHGVMRLCRSRKWLRFNHVAATEQEIMVLV